MRIYVMRHGIADDREDPACPPDPERRLTVIGARRTRQASRGLAKLNVEIDLCMTSPYLRARETMTLVMDALQMHSVPLRTSEALLPMAHPEEILGELRRLQPEGVLLVGHAPQVDRLLTLMLTAADGEGTWMKKAGAAFIEISADLSPGDALLRWLIPPKALRALA